MQRMAGHYQKGFNSWLHLVLWHCSRNTLSQQLRNSSAGEVVFTARRLCPEQETPAGARTQQMTRNDSKPPNMNLLKFWSHIPIMTLVKWWRILPPTIIYKSSTCFSLHSQPSHFPSIKMFNSNTPASPSDYQNSQDATITWSELPPNKRSKLPSSKPTPALPSWLFPALLSCALFSDAANGGFSGLHRTQSGLSALANLCKRAMMDFANSETSGGPASLAQRPTWLQLGVDGIHRFWMFAFWGLTVFHVQL